MRRLNRLYRFKNVLQAPYDHSTDPEVDNKMFATYTASTSLKNLPDNSFDLVWNFGFVQRQLDLIYDMVRVSRRYVLAFVPNGLNPGNIVHWAYHKVYGGPCDHPERGDRRFMSLPGLNSLFQTVNLEVLEAGYVDAPIWFDTAVSLAEVAGSSSKKYLKFQLPEWLLSVERLTMPFGKIMAHYVYSLGKKES